MTDYHADDYGLFPTQSWRIMDCIRGGVVNGVSVMPNSPYLSEYMEMLRPFVKDLRIAVHLNFMEGHSICTPEEIDLLVNKRGIFNVSFGKLLLASVLPGRRRYRAQLKKEIRAQIHAVTPYLEDRPRRIDSHSHYHMLPVVFDALMDVIQEENLSVSYIRIPEEYVKIYFSCRKELVQFLPINLLKVLVLNLLAKRNKRKYRKFLESLEQSVFCGVMYSGRMCSQNMGVLLPEMEHLAKRCGKNLEVLAHPGGVYEQEDIGLLTNEGDVAFLTSDLRQAEAEAFISLKSHTDGKSADDLCI